MEWGIAKKFLFLSIALTYASSEFPFQNVSLSWEERVDDLVNRLTLEEMAQQMSHELPRTQEGVPGIPRLGIKNYTWSTECLRGDVGAGNATAFPQPIGLGATFDTDLLLRVARAIGMEVRAKNNYFEQHGIYGQKKGLSCYSPVINIMRDARWGRNQETYGEDPFLTGVLAQHYVWGLQGNSTSRYLLVSSGCKHIDVYSGPENIPDSRFSFAVNVTMRDWRTTYLPAFKKCVEAGTFNIMCSYTSINGIPACANKELLTDILRDEWGFKGYIGSDSGALEHIIYSHHYLNNTVDAVVECINAGVSLDLASGKFDYTPIYYSIPDAVNQGRLTVQKIREMMKPMWNIRMRLGEFDPPEINPYKQMNLSVIESPAHRALAIEAATKSFVLLKNQKFLPLMNQVYVNISFIGPMANSTKQLFGDYAPDTDLKLMKTPMETLKVLGYDIRYTSGCMDGTRCLKYSSQLVAKAVENTNLVVVCLGLGVVLEAELNDRRTIDLPGHQLQLLQDAVNGSPANAPVMLLLFNGGPVDIRWADSSDRVVAIIQAFYPAQAAGDALLETVIMAGPYANPAARLPFTWPASDDDIPSMTDYSVEGRSYRYPKIEPLYPFGYGLSYTSFAYSNLNIADQVKTGSNVIGFVNITNTGFWGGDEVVQIYLSWPDFSEPTPQLQLVYFQRISTDSGQTFKMDFIIEEESMSIWTDAGWQIPKGKYTLYAGGQQPNVKKSVGSNVLSASFMVY
ncbi:uncharacterized protein LOC126817636 [Patella vulgata]|uniref:uncharacterized protein LOC126817636 n=1 Tax=Patella vulgata TaxID=6465 RepID=UPI002180022D|nr:uncharacterized protein LOC126817636 [Patella vulgata]